MSKLTIDAAAFHGFGMIRRDPPTFLGVAVLLTGFGVGVVLLLVPMYARMIGALMELPQDYAQDDPFVAFGILGDFWAGMAWFYLILLPVYAVVLAAMNRSLIFGRSKGWVLGLKLGMDELRVILVSIIGYFASILAGYAAILLGVAVGLAVLFSSVGAGGEPSGPAAAVGFIVLVAGYIVGVGLMIWVGVRLSLAGPATVGERRFVIFESWSMTRGRFWTLFLAYVIVYLLLALAELVIVVVVLTLSSGWLGTVDWENVDVSAFEQITIGPALVAGGVAYGLCGTFFLALFLGVAARGYVAWKEASATAPAAVPAPPA